MQWGEFVEEKGIIVDEKSDYVLVKVIRHSACGDCDKNCGLSVDAEQKETTFEIKKEPYTNYKKGQQVILEMEEKNFVLVVLFVYVFPLILMIGGYFLLEALFGTEASGILGSLGGLALGFLIVKRINQKILNNSSFEPQIKEILD